jgi:MFS family permease
MHASGRGRWVGLGLLSLGTSLIIVDATIVNVATPNIIGDLGIDSSQAEWVNTTYALVFAALLITAGRLGDTYGRRRNYLVGLVIFSIASILAGAANSGTLLILARVLQGVGGAMILPSTTSILNANFQGKDRAAAFGIWGATIGGMAAVGPLIGGWFTTYMSWRWAFYINIPFGILAFAGTLYYVGESRDEDAKAGFDLPGFLLVTFGLGSFVFGLIEGRSFGWWEPMRPFSLLGWNWPLESMSTTPFALGGGVLALLWFARVEIVRKRAGKFHLFDFSLWQSRSFGFGNLAGTILSLGEFGLIFGLPLFFQGVLGYDAFHTGLAFLTLALGSFAAAGGTAPLTKARGPRSVVRIGMGLEVIGILGTALLISRETTILALALPLFIYGMGVGFASAQLTSIVLSVVPVGRSGLASGANTTLRQVGSGLGIAILGTVLFSTLVTTSDANLEARLPGMSATCRTLVTTLVDETAGQILPALRDPGAALNSATPVDSLPTGQVACFRDPAFIRSLPIAAEAVDDAFVSATRIMGFTAAGFVSVGFVLTLLLPADIRRREEDVEPLTV